MIRLNSPVSQLSTFSQNNKVPQHSVECVGRPKHTQETQWMEGPAILHILCSSNRRPLRCRRSERPWSLEMSNNLRRTCLWISVLETPWRGFPPSDAEAEAGGNCVARKTPSAELKSKCCAQRGLNQLQSQRTPSKEGKTALTLTALTGDISGLLPFTLMT